MKTPDLSGKAAIVTGSTKGIGRSVAEALLDHGADVLISARTESEVQAAAEELNRRGGGRAIGRVCDVRDPDDCWALIEAAEDEFGRLDILVNNAGVGRFDSIKELSLDDYRLQIETNLNGVFYCSKAAVPHLSETGDGWIINIGSLAGKNPFSGGSGYNASKFGLRGMSEAMMLDLRYDDIRVSAIMPGSVATYFNDHEPGPDDAWKIQPEDVAETVLQLLAYPKNTHVSKVEMRPSQPPRK